MPIFPQAMATGDYYAPPIRLLSRADATAIFGRYASRCRDDDIKARDGFAGRRCMLLFAATISAAVPFTFSANALRCFCHDTRHGQKTLLRDDLFCMNDTCRRLHASLLQCRKMLLLPSLPFLDNDY